jgi:hypothetical protein
LIQRKTRSRGKEKTGRKRRGRKRRRTEIAEETEIEI